ncbi:DUF1294 domain-containing protein [Novosphingobium sp. KCTC 2891]|uniref:DUF1294 domain-containing protein n=1 Tax=Novosphingobium sp. KCTC 2891 TaxID=2989730 RepID=UPI00222302FA|nr:DUF1294 domain-containing protein [Novosphingobium sp. KCTC 2891]MCW1383282.1 DUF1294 domain-containing protein [Novosphingobium sp. KCTC 2891]
MPFPLAPADIAAAIVAVNFTAFAAFGIDKWKAETGRWRIAESTLLLLAFIGGSVGAYLGRHLFRHKTRKQPFSSTLHSIAVVQILALGAAAGWTLAG